MIFENLEIESSEMQRLRGLALFKRAAIVVESKRFARLASQAVQHILKRKDEILKGKDEAQIKKKRKFKEKFKKAIADGVKDFVQQEVEKINEIKRLRNSEIPGHFQMMLRSGNVRMPSQISDMDELEDLLDDESIHLKPKGLRKSLKSHLEIMMGSPSFQNLELVGDQDYYQKRDSINQKATMNRIDTKKELEISIEYDNEEFEYRDIASEKADINWPSKSIPVNNLQSRREAENEFELAVLKAEPINNEEESLGDISIEEINTKLKNEVKKEMPDENDLIPQRRGSERFGINPQLFQSLADHCNHPNLDILIKDSQNKKFEVEEFRKAVLGFFERKSKLMENEADSTEDHGEGEDEDFMEHNCSEISSEDFPTEVFTYDWEEETNPGLCSELVQVTFYFYKAKLDFFDMNFWNMRKNFNSTLGETLRGVLN